MAYTALKVTLLCGATALVAPSVAADDLTDNLTATLDELAEQIGPDSAETLRSAIDTAPEGVTGDTLGHLLFARRHFDAAAWVFGSDALADPTDPASLSNFATLLAEVGISGAGAIPSGWLETARAASDAATRQAPDSAPVWNTLSGIARLQGDSAVAVKAAREATSLAPNEPLYWANLARALDLAGEAELSADAMGRAHALQPNSLAVLTTPGDLSEGVGKAYRSQLAQNCNVDFRCQDICPKSIIGGVQSVTCEMENAYAQMACQEGKPYPTSFDCAEDFPDYGIMIPGLHSGFSIAVPGFSAHVKVDGEGNVDVRVSGGVSTGPVSAYLSADGHYSPNGGASFDKFGGGTRINILPVAGGGAAAKIAGDLGHPPAHIELEGGGDKPAEINIEAYNAGLISF